MSPIAYIDTPSGISGDIFLGCLVDAGWPIEALNSVIEGFPVARELWSVEEQKTTKGALAATRVRVVVEPEADHRHLSDILALLDQARLSSSVRRQARAVFTRLAKAEASVHGSEIEDVHFHEVGALDAIIDIVGVCAGLETLQIEQLYASPLPLGPGWTRSEHGPIPLPAPATLALLTAAQAPVVPAPGPGELVTPTGAALLAELAIFAQPPMKLRKLGTGAGQKEFPWPNIARLWIGSATEKEGSDSSPATGDPSVSREEVILLETNIDDMNPELYGSILPLMLDEGALDAWTTPIQMKKGRPGTLLSVLTPTALAPRLTELIFTETTTLGVRQIHLGRDVATRTFVEVETAYGTVPIKLKWLRGEIIGASPEFDTCLQLAKERGSPVRLVYAAAAAAAERLYQSEE